MRSATIGSLEVSVVGLGCNNLGRSLDKAASANVVNTALDAGMTFFDTSSNYGEGQSERFLGIALGSRRDQVVVATKFGMPVAGWEGSGGASPRYARQVLERSLRELGTDYIDLWMVHFPDESVPIEDTLGVMQEAVDQGKVRQLGSSNFDVSQLEEALDVSVSIGAASFTCDQVHYSVIHRDPEESGLQRLCMDRQVALLPYYPLASGLLTGKTRRGAEPVGRLRMARYQEFLTEENFDVAEAIEAFADERGITMVQAALGWLLSRPAVPSVTPGATTAEQVIGNAAAAEWQPSTEDLDQLDALLS